MTSRERVKRAIHFQGVDRMPHYLLGLDRMFVAYYEEPEHLDAAVGGKLAFWCPVDIQQTMIHGSLDDIRAYAKRMIATLGRHNGGLVSMAYSTPETIRHTSEKIAAMCAAFREYGVYCGGGPC